jgi:hypothetical protein
VASSATRLGGYERTQSPVGPAEAHSCNFRDIIDFLTMHPDARRQVVRLLAEMDARGVRFSV